jgi:hypothetical protein
LATLDDIILVLFVQNSHNHNNTIQWLRATSDLPSLPADQIK